MLASIWAASVAPADTYSPGLSLPSAGPARVCEMPGVDAAALVQAVRDSERWVHEARSLSLRIESVWARAAAEQSSELSGGEGPASCGCGPLTTTSKGLLEYAFDGSRFRFREDQTGQSRSLKIWDGKQFFSHEAPSGRRGYYLLDRTTQGNLEDVLTSKTAWLRSQPHSFWWDSKDVAGLLAYYGQPKDFTCITREDYRGVACHVLELRPTEVRAILHGQSYGCDSGTDDYQQQGFIGEVRGLADQSCRWYIGVEDGLLRGITWRIAERPRIEHWMRDYREVAPGWWFPMTQGYQVYNKDAEGRAYVESRRDLKVLEIKVNERLPEELFQLEIEQGARVQDRRSGSLITHEYRPEPPELLGKPLPPLNESFARIDPASLEGKPVLVCFWDMHQRPSRHCIRQLARQASRLQGVEVIAIQTAGIDATLLNEWIQANDISFPVLTMAGKQEDILFTWNVQSLPWLILTDRNHVVKARGFPMQELDRQLASVAGKSEQWAASH
jgi:hypothetical protein